MGFLFWFLSFSYSVELETCGLTLSSYTLIGLKMRPSQKHLD